MKAKKLVILISTLLLSVSLTACGSQNTQKNTTTQNASTKKAAVGKKNKKEKLAETKSVLSNFGEKWINFSSIYKRNQSVRKLLTDRAIKDNSIDIDPHASFSSTGQITNVYQEIGKSNSFLLIGKQHSQKQVFELVLRLEIVQKGEHTKINKITTSYVRTEH